MMQNWFVASYYGQLVAGCYSPGSCVVQITLEVKTYYLSGQLVHSPSLTGWLWSDTGKDTDDYMFIAGAQSYHKG